MEIPKTLPPADPLRPSGTGLGERNAPALPLPAPAAPRPDIRPLDLAGALQILVAEVELTLAEAGLRDAAPVSVAPGTLAADVEGAGESLAARALLGAFLDAVPSAAEEPARFIATLQRVTQLVAAGSQSAIDRVAAWSGTPASLTAALQRGQQLALRLVHEPVEPPILAHPEWLGLARELSRVRRLRRRQERRLLLTQTDADWLDEGGPQATQDSAARRDDEPGDAGASGLSGERHP